MIEMIEIQFLFFVDIYAFRSLPVHLCWKWADRGSSGQIWALSKVYCSPRSRDCRLDWLTKFTISSTKKSLFALLGNAARRATLLLSVFFREGERRRRRRLMRARRDGRIRPSDKTRGQWPIEPASKRPQSSKCKRHATSINKRHGEKDLAHYKTWNFSYRWILTVRRTLLDFVVWKCIA